jgi:hypothetical protein
MEVEFRPEPTAEERAAMLAVLVDLQDGKHRGSLWWEAGVHEAVEDEPATSLGSFVGRLNGAFDALGGA